MKNRKKETNGYMSVGELAERANVTIRTLQYYDQTGLLSPSVKGTRNQRLYTEKDLEKLYRILCYKYMGLSLKEIRAQVEKDADTSHISNTLHQQIKEAELAVSEQMKRYFVLKDLEMLADSDLFDPDWIEYADLIEYIQNKWEVIWKLNLAYEGASDSVNLTGKDSEEIGRYYKLVADTIDLKNQGVPPEDEAVMALIEEYFKIHNMNASDKTWNAKQELIKVRPEIMKLGLSEYADFWTDIKSYLSKASDHYYNSRRKTDED